MEEALKLVRVNHRMVNLGRIVDAYLTHHPVEAGAAMRDTLTVRFVGETEVTEYRDDDARALWHALCQQARDVSHLGQRPISED